MPRVKIDYRSAGKPSFKIFRKKHPNIDISFTTWKEIIYSYNKKFSDNILETGEKRKLIGRLGPFAIVKAKLKRQKIVVNGKEIILLPVNWKRSKELGKRIYHLNHHTEGFHFKWKWFKDDARFKMSEFWYFEPYRELTRKINPKIQSDPEAQFIYQEWR